VENHTQHFPTSRWRPGNGPSRIAERCRCSRATTGAAGGHSRRRLHQTHCLRGFQRDQQRQAGRLPLPARSSRQAGCRSPQRGDRVVVHDVSVSTAAGRFMHRQRAVSSASTSVITPRAS
jgi:hypothetical protein